MTMFRSPATANEEATSYFLAARAFGWMATYEAKVLDSLGLEYRKRTLREWHFPILLPQLMPGEWHKVALRFRKISNRCKARAEVIANSEFAEIENS
jgi:hypothetical protein